MNATVCPKDNAYPTDLGLLNDARVKSEMLIDLLFDKDLHAIKPRDYREKARKVVGQQLRYLRRNIKIIHFLLDSYQAIPLKKKELKYLYVIQTLFEQQNYMFETITKSVSDRIVSIHQPYIRPIVRGKSQVKVEFGSKIHCSMIDGITFLDELNWNAFNEGSHLKQYV